MKINSILAGIALAAGLFAAFTNHSENNGLYPEWKYSVERQDGDKFRYISANFLADHIYQKEKGIIILDARTRDKYDEYHIPGAIYYSDKALEKALASGEKIVICAGSGYPISSGKKLKQQNKIYFLKGGLDEWYRLVLFPDFDELKVRNTRLLEQIIKRSGYFGGKPVNAESLNITLRTSRFREGC